jgi:hypothetical protein
VASRMSFTDAQPGHRTGRRMQQKASFSARHGGGVELAGRLGHVAKAASYALIAILALQVALGDRAQPEDRQGVLRELAGQPFGTAALIALAVGFAGYAVWQFMRAIFDRSNDGDDAKGWAKRAHHAGVGAIYVGSAAIAISLVVGSRSAGGGSEKEETAKVLDWPMGPWLVGAVGVAIAAYGLANLWKAHTKKFCKDLDQGSMSPTVRRWTTRAGVVGHIARGIVFGLVGVFLTKAAVEYDPDEAVGIDGALAKLAHQDYGAWLLGLVAVGLLAYAVFCLVQARYRRV